MAKKDEEGDWYWIKYTNDRESRFWAINPTEAYRYFRMEGDHAYDYGIEDKKKPRTKRGLWF